MTEFVNTISDSVFGTSSVPTTAGVMGPIQGTPGILGTGGSFNLDSILANGSSFASAAATLFAGRSAAEGDMSAANTEAASLYNKSQDELLAAKQSLLEGQQKSNQIVGDLVQVLAQQRLAFAGNGMDPTFGTPVAVGKATKDIADRQLSTTRDDANTLALQRRMQSLSYLQERSNVLKAGKQKASADYLTAEIKAGSTLSDAKFKELKRG